MPLETSVICLDTSEWMRNGDYTPTRLGAQYDSVTTMCACKVNQNPENTVGLLSYSSKGVRLLTAPTEDQGKLYAVLTDMKPEGGPAMTQAIKTAMLALKHRKNKNGGQRVVVFNGSPIDASPEELKQLGTLMRRNNIGLDIVSLGENDANAAGFQVLLDAANKDGNSRLLMVPAGVLPSEMLSASPIMMGDIASGGGAGAGAGAGGAAGGGGHAAFGGVDPSMDPELAEALRLSMEEARAAQALEDTATGAGGGGAGPAAAAAAGPVTGGAPGGMAVDGDDDAELAAALALSMEIGQQQAAAAASAERQPAGTSAPDVAAASASTGSAPAPAPAPAAAAAPGASAAAPAGAPAAAATAAPEAFSNPDFIQSVLESMPGVDISDPELQAAIAAALGGAAPGGSAGAGGSGSGDKSSGGGGGGAGSGKGS